MTQLQFSLAEGEKRKSEGMERAAENRSQALERARKVALKAGLFNGGVTADDVYHQLTAEQRTALGPAAGSIFSEEHWEFTGQWVKSTRASNHARMIRVWRLK